MNKAIFNTNLELDYAGNEAINTICSNLTFAGKNIKKIVITSCEPNDGKSFVSVQIAINMGRRGKKALLLDADMRMSVLNTHHNIQLTGAGFGLAHVLSGQCQTSDAIYETNIQNVFYMPIGAEVQTPLSLIATPDFDKFMHELNDNYEYIVIDAPPVGMVIDAAEIAKSCDGSVIVIEYSKTHRRTLMEAKKQMERTGTPILGCVLNKIVMDRISTRKYYGYGKYGYKQGYYNKNNKNK